MRALLDEHPLIGTVHTTGLYLGVESVGDPQTREPAADMNILKTKPPLRIDVDAADFYVDTLDRVLTEGW